MKVSKFSEAQIAFVLKQAGAKSVGTSAMKCPLIGVSAGGYDKTGHIELA